MRVSTCIAAAVALLPGLLFAADAIERPLTFTTEGGDAWTLLKPIALETPSNACDAVWITSPVGTFAARREDSSFVAGIPLAAGDNALSAQCIKNGWIRGAPAVQHWTVRLTGCQRLNLQPTRHMANRPPGRKTSWSTASRPGSLVRVA